MSKKYDLFCIKIYIKFTIIKSDIQDKLSEIVYKMNDKIKDRK